MVLLDDFDTDVGVGEQWLYFFSPFGETVLATKEIFFVSDIVSFVEILESVEIEMEDREAVGGCVLVDDGEGGAADVVGHAERVTEFFDQCGLADAHRAEEGEEAMIGELCQQVVSYLWQLVDGICYSDG